MSFADKMASIRKHLSPLRLKSAFQNLTATPEERWEVASVLSATPNGFFPEQAYRYEEFPTKAVAESEARSLEAMFGRHVVVRPLPGVRKWKSSDWQVVCARAAGLLQE